MPIDPYSAEMLLTEHLTRTLRPNSGMYRAAIALLIAAAVTACSGREQAAPPAATAVTPATALTPPAADAPIPDTPSPFDVLPEAVRDSIDKPFTGDFDALVKRRSIRVGVTFNRTHYFVDKGQERGLTFEALKLFESDLNADLKTGNLKVHVVIDPAAARPAVPGPRRRQDRHGRRHGDRPTRAGEARGLLGADTRERQRSGGHRPRRPADRYSGRPVRPGGVRPQRRASMRRASSRLNAQLKARGKPPVVIDEAPDVLEDDDILEMVNAGLAPITIVDDYLAGFWSKVFTDIKVHKDVTVRTGGNLAVAFRKENPRLREVVNTWLRKHGKGDGFRNTVERRYLENTKFAKNAASDAERQKLAAVVELFKKYGAEYDVDYLLMAAQGYQESTLDQNVKSPVGAIGVMQVMPPTGKELNVGDITEVDANIHAGVKYMRFMMDHYYKDDPMDPLNKGLMTFASYNAGPGRIRQLRAETKKRGLDPNVWFGNVERVASERIGRETVTYVSNIYKYYITYQLLTEQQERRAAAKADIAKRK